MNSRFRFNCNCTYTREGTVVVELLLLAVVVAVLVVCGVCHCKVYDKKLEAEQALVQAMVRALAAERELFERGLAEAEGGGEDDDGEEWKRSGG